MPLKSGKDKTISESHSSKKLKQLRSHSQNFDDLEKKFQKRKNRPIKQYEEDIDIVLLYLDRIEELLEQILQHRVDLAIEINNKTRTKRKEKNNAFQKER